MEKILIAMSGGVDSSAAAHLILSKGYEAVGATMTVTCGLPGNSDRNTEAEMAARICQRLGIGHKTVDLCDEFRKYVADDFAARYLEGKTPNPCIVCNKFIKFGSLMRVADELGCTRLATGHYAIVEKDTNGRCLLKAAKDKTKDQSYMLWTLSGEQLSRVIFPLGGYTKAEIRELAGELTFENADKKDSQDVCFVPDGDYAKFINEYTGISPKAGNYVDMEGTILGKHKGIIHYTVGQRKGLGIALGQPMFIHSKSALTDEVVLCRNDELFSKTLTANGINLIACDRIDTPTRLLAKARYHHAAAPATVVQIDENRLSVEFDEPVRAISPGQSVVLYDGDTVIGGGIIE